eukprot:10820-Heterococcus_DN1.PRE.5
MHASYSNLQRSDQSSKHQDAADTFATKSYIWQDKMRSTEDLVATVLLLLQARHSGSSYIVLPVHKPTRGCEGLPRATSSA